MLSATGDEKRDRLTLENTIKNQSVKKVDDNMSKPKPKKSCSFVLDNNITYAFDKTHSV